MHASGVFAVGCQHASGTGVCSPGTSTTATPSSTITGNLPSVSGSGDTFGADDDDDDDDVIQEYEMDMAARRRAGKKREE